MNLKEMFDDALPLITQFAPSIGAAIGGPCGASFGYALPILANAFNHSPSDIRGLVKKIALDSDSQAKLEALENEHGTWISTLRDSVGTLSKANINISLEWDTQK